MIPMPPQKAMFFETLPSQKVRCGLCAHRCVILPNETGFCRVRQNIDGVLYSLNYGFVVSETIDPIEKKPLYHFHPGATTYSLGTIGCNFKCSYCQNHRLAQPADSVYLSLQTGDCLQYGEFVTPEEVVKRALFLESKIISFTYNEPTVWYEFVYETSVLAKENGLCVVWVTNGSITPEALKTAAPYIDAYCVDIKSFSNDFYNTISSAELEPVLTSVLTAKNLGIHVETVTLLIPNQNDSVHELEKLAEWIFSHLGSETPVHLTAFKPHFKMKDVSETPVSLLERARAVFLTAGLEYVYIGNAVSEYQNTYCPDCHALLAYRRLLFGEAVNLKRKNDDYFCSYCNRKIPFICSEDDVF